MAAPEGAGVIGERVRRLTRGASRARALAAGLTVLGWMVPVLVLAFSAAIILDALHPLAAGVRQGVSFALLGLCALGLVAACVTALCARRTGLILLGARFGERILLAAGLLPRLASASDDVSAALAARAVERGDERAAQASVWRGARWGMAGIAWCCALAMLLAGGLGASMDSGARALAFALSRFADPAGDHPPFTWTDFDLEIDPAAPLTGDDVRLTVRVRGQLIDDLDLILRDPLTDAVLAQRPLRVVERNDAGAPITFATTLADLRKPVRAHASGRSGRSRSIAINPIDRPRLRAAWIEATPPGGESETIPLLAGREREIVLPEGSTVVIAALTSTEIASVEASGLAGVWPFETSTSGRGARVAIDVAQPGEASITMDPLSRAGFGLEEPLRVRLTALAPSSGRIDGVPPQDRRSDSLVIGQLGEQPGEPATGDGAGATDAASGGATERGDGRGKGAGEEAEERKREGEGAGAGEGQRDGRRGEAEGSWERVIPAQGQETRAIDPAVARQWEGEIGPIDAEGPVSELAARYFEAVARWFARGGADTEDDR